MSPAPWGNVCGAAACCSDKWDSIYMTQWFVRRARGREEWQPETPRHSILFAVPAICRRWSVWNQGMKLLSASCCHMRHLVWDWLPICDQDLESRDATLRNLAVKSIHKGTCFYSSKTTWSLLAHDQVDGWSVDSMHCRFSSRPPLKCTWYHSTTNKYTLNSVW